MKEFPRVTNTQVRIASAILTLFGIFYTWEAFQLPMGKPVGSGSGSTPALIGVAWSVIGAYVTVRVPEITLGEDGEGLWPNAEGTRRIVMVLLLCTGFILAMNYFGIIATSVVFHFIMAVAFGGGLLQALLTSTLLSAALWLVFVHLLQVRLPTGTLVTTLFGG
jgi:hypothetical protein